MIPIHASRSPFPTWRLALTAVLLVVTATFSVSAAERGFIEYIGYTFDVGGSTMYMLLVLSVIGLGFGIERLVRLQKKQFVTTGLSDQARQLKSQGELDFLRTLGERHQCGLARGIEAIVPYLHESVDEVRTIASDVLSAEVRAHQRKVQPLAAIATLAPLLGLFGTVIGMMGAFENFRMLGETGDPTVFAGDISKAMVTTATGLIVAMPALAMHYILKNRTSALGDNMAMELSQLISEWCLTSQQIEIPSVSQSSSVAQSSLDDE